MSGFTESVVEDAALAWLEALDYQVLHGPDIAPGEPAAERNRYEDVVLAGRLREALERLLPPGTPLLLVCAKGMRAYEATRILRHAGWDDVLYLAGGAQLRRPQLPDAG